MSLPHVGSQYPHVDPLTSQLCSPRTSIPIGIWNVGSSKKASCPIPWEHQNCRRLAISGQVIQDMVGNKNKDLPITIQ